MRVNNLGGMGPGGGPPHIYYANVGNLQGHSIDCVVTTVGNNYDSDNANYVMRRGWFRMSGRQFIGKYNGFHTVAGAGTIGSLKSGSYEVTFKFMFADDKSPAKIPYLPFTFYDIDGREQTSTCDALWSTSQKMGVDPLCGYVAVQFQVCHCD